MNNKRDYYEIHNNNNNNEDDNEDDDYMNFQVIDDNKPNESNCKSKSSTLLNLSKKQKKVLVTNMMENSIKTGLSKAITKQSKGFQLLEKFGYKGVGGLGKNLQGLHEPIPVSKKEEAVSGLGVEEKEKRIINSIIENKKNIIILNEKSIQNFQNRKRESSLINKMEKDIIKAEKSIYELDFREEIEFNNLWPVRVIDEINNKNSDGDGDDINKQDLITSDFVINIKEKLEDRLIYLRSIYHYCMYCGHKYDDKQDLIINCPGLYEDDH